MKVDTMRTFDAILAAVDPQAPAILAPGRVGMTFGALREQCRTVAVVLGGFGVGRGDVIAIVLPNGPEMAACFIAVASCAVAAPLNPAYRRDEFGYYLDDLKPELVIVMAGTNSDAVTVAQDRGISVARLRPDLYGPAGNFTLELPLSRDGAGGCEPGFNGPDDEALVLHTSGTTARPKIVPLSLRNICASACNIATTLALTPNDRCLNIMPLFHIHGLVAAVSSSLAAGASVVCTPGFDALKFFGWMEQTGPTWYTAVPTMHQMILSRSKRNAGIIDNTRLRFARSSSSALPAPVARGIEAAFGCPVIESYGMTEAAHQMTSNRLPPGKRVLGSVGASTPTHQYINLPCHFRVIVIYTEILL